MTGGETCPPGQVGSEEKAAFHCIPCLPGTHASSDSSRCLTCEQGSVSLTGAAVCKVCEPGTRADSQTNECVPCAAGTVGRTAGLSNPECSGKCKAGSYSYRSMSTCIPCEAGKHSSFSGSETCELCEDDPSYGRGFTSLLGKAECVCVGGRYLDAQGVCSLCKEGMDCELGSELQSLRLNTGYWRPSISSIEVLKCPAKDACINGNNNVSNGTDGGVLVAADVCRAGNRGPMCATCDVG